jgi:hypothetical protein
MYKHLKPYNLTELDPTIFFSPEAVALTIEPRRRVRQGDKMSL